MRSLELVNELLKCEPTKETLLLLMYGGDGTAYDMAIMYGSTDIANSIKQYANRRCFNYSLKF
jgi:hypothetical protein